MHDPKFEKSVQQKMEELEFAPSAAVWAGVERAVREKRRRRVPLYWFIITPLLVLTGASLLYFHPFSSPAGAGVAVSGPGVTIPSATVGSPAVGSAAGASTAGNIEAGTSTGASSVEGSAAGGSSLAGNSMRGSSVPGPAAAGRYIAGGAAAGVEGDRQVPGSTRHLARHLGNNNKSPDGAERIGVAAEEDVFGGKEMRSVSGVSGIGGEKDGKGGMRVPDLTLHKVSVPGVEPFGRDIAAIRALRPVGRMSSSADNKTVKLTPKYQWEAAVIGGVGLSSLNENLLHSTAIAQSAIRYSAAPITASPHTTVTNAQPDLSFWAGIAMQKNMTKNLSVSVGFDLHYYSSRLRVGKETKYYNLAANNGVSSQQASSLFVGPPVVSAVDSNASGYYTPGNDYVYKNRYYFFEVPASVALRLNHSVSMPLFWSGGITFSYLMSSNALAYNTHSAVYYKDNTLYNKAQFNLSTALLIGLPLKGLHLAAGPELQYGLTDLLKSSASGVSEHLFYGGIRLVWVPGKGHK